MYQAYSNPILFHASPKIQLWNITGSSNILSIYRRVLDVTESPLKLEHIQFVDEILGVSVFSDEGANLLSNLDSKMGALSRKNLGQYKATSPRALQSLIRGLANKAHQAQVVNEFWHQSNGS